MARFLVMADGPDEPGIVAAVTGVLASEGANLQDTSMTRLGGRFVMLLMVEAQTHDGATLLEALTNGVQGFDLDLAVDEFGEEEDVPASVVEGERWSVSVHGADHPGIVAAVTSRLAARGVNVDDLTTRVIGSADAPTYMMLIDVTVPADVNGDDLARELDEVGQELGVSCHARPVDADIL